MFARLGRLAAAHSRPVALACTLRAPPLNGWLTAGVGALTATAASAGLAAAAEAAAADVQPASIKPTKVMCLHGINLNMFGKRDSAVYGSATLNDIDQQLLLLAFELGMEIECFQTNHEGEMVEKVHKVHTSGEYGAVLINAGAWTHYSYGLRDALAILTIPVIEVHMSNIHAREDMAGSQGEQMRHHSVVSPLAKGIVAGFGLESYLLGLRAAASLLGTTAGSPPKKKNKDRMPFAGA